MQLTYFLSHFVYEEVLPNGTFKADNISHILRFSVYCVTDKRNAISLQLVVKPHKATVKCLQHYKRITNLFKILFSKILLDLTILM